jgi:oligoribonuclease NrnB/cAMP/cGMP phosphodiesterase (DHH superfamily)
MAVINKRNAALIQTKSFPLTFGGLRFLALNTPQKGSLSFQSATTEGIDGYLVFAFDGRKWTVSMYGVEGKDIDLSIVAKQWGGGGHKNACGFTCDELPWISGPHRSV